MIPSSVNELIDLPEAALIEKLVHDWPTLYDLFNFVVRPALGEPRDRQGWDYTILGNLPRRYFGLSNLGQPGDIDVLIVPVPDGRCHPELCAAIEVKRLALRGPNWEKGTDRYGLSQASGLLRAGFPYVGLMHLVVSLPGPKRNHRPASYGEMLDSDGRFEIVGDFVHDMTDIDAAERQYRRIFSQNPASELGVNCLSVSECILDGARRAITSMTPGRDAARNPRTNSTLVHNVGVLMEAWKGDFGLRRFDARRAPAT